MSRYALSPIGKALWGVRSILRASMRHFGDDYLKLTTQANTSIIQAPNNRKVMNKNVICIRPMLTACLLTKQAP